MEGNIRYVALDITQTEEGVLAEQNNYITFSRIITNTLQGKRRNVDIFGIINEM